MDSQHTLTTISPAPAPFATRGGSPSKVAATPRLRAATSCATPLRVERVDAAGIHRHIDAWADLCARAIEPNVFLEPGFALPLLQHVAAARRPSFLLVWDEDGPVSFGRLIGLVALHLDGAGSAFGGIARGFAHPQTTSALPLIDRDRAPDALDAVLAWLARRAGGRPALVLDGIAADGALHDALATLCARSGRALHVLDAHTRAVLRRPASGAPGVTLLASAKRRKEHARQSRRLSEVGRRSYTSARTAEEVAAATEAFLALEHRGWKGRRGTSLLGDPARATFTRSMTRLMAAADGCRIDAIEIDGRPVAMGIVLTSGDRAFFWKTCFDEGFGPLSPGVHFARELTQVQLADRRVAMTDSCAVADHPMIDRMWPGRMRIVDVMIATAPGGRRFGWLVQLERARRQLRRGTKAALGRLRRLRATIEKTKIEKAAARHDLNG